MSQWIYLILALRYASASLINTDLRAPLAGVVPNQLRIYREYPVQSKSNADKEGEGQKILVNCTIKSINERYKDTDKMIKKTTANCTVTHDRTGIEKNAEGGGVKTGQKSSENVDGLENERVINFEEPHDSSVTEDSDVQFDKLSRTGEHRQESEGENESEKLIPLIIEAVASDPDGDSDIEVDITKWNDTSEATNDDQLILVTRRMWQENQATKEVSLDTDKGLSEYSNALKKSPIQSQSENSSMQRNLNAEEIVSHIHEKEQSNLEAAKGHSSTDPSIENKQATNEAEKAGLVVESEIGSVLTTLIGNDAKPFSNPYTFSNTYNAAERQAQTHEIPHTSTVDLRASSPNFENIYERRTTQPSTETADYSTLRSANNELLSNEHLRTAAKESLDEQTQRTTQNNPPETTEGASFYEEARDFLREMGWNFLPDLSQKTEPTQTEDYKASTSVTSVTNNPVSRPVIKDPVLSDLNDQLHLNNAYQYPQAGKGFDNAVPYFNHIYPRYVPPVRYGDGLQYGQYGYNNPQIPAYNQWTSFEDPWSYDYSLFHRALLKILQDATKQAQSYISQNVPV